MKLFEEFLKEKFKNNSDKAHLLEYLYLRECFFNEDKKVFLLALSDVLNSDCKNIKVIIKKILKEYNGINHKQTHRRK